MIRPTNIPLCTDWCCTRIRNIIASSYIYNLYCVAYLYTTTVITRVRGPYIYIHASNRYELIIIIIIILCSVVELFVSLGRMLHLRPSARVTYIICMRREAAMVPARRGGINHLVCIILQHCTSVQLVHFRIRVFCAFVTYAFPKVWHWLYLYSRDLFLNFRLIPTGW